MIKILPERMFAIFAILTFVLVVGWIGYCEFSTSQVTVAVQLKTGEDPFTALKQILPANSSVLAIKEMDRGKNQYQMVVQTRHSKNMFLEWLKSSKKVEKVEDCSK